MSVPTVGIIGGGFVGGAIAKGFSEYTDVKVFDKELSRSTHNHLKVRNQDIIFVCVPTPMEEDGSVDCSFLESALRRLSETLAEEGCEEKIVIVKSTTPPNKLREFHEKFRNLKLVFSPEFLTERTAHLDFQQSTRNIFGVWNDITKASGISEIERLFKFRFPNVPLIWCLYEEASLVKYFTNTFFATKVALLNEFYQVCQKMNIDFAEMIGMMLLDTRIGRSHFKVPGHDGKLGFGGHCFPKDINGYFEIAKDLGVDPTVSKAAWDKNLEVRPEKDWELDVGRAVSKRKS
ncbi:MAG: hypothetical protein ACXABY_07225 [Candidatus Thorarchaeota archaeon]|jgi:UDPglucose 6-dehydrogenase